MRNRLLTASLICFTGAILGIILLVQINGCATFSFDRDCHIYALEQQQRVSNGKILYAEGVNKDGEFWGHYWMVFESNGRTYGVDRAGSWKYKGNQKDKSALNIAAYFSYPHIVKTAEWR